VFFITLYSGERIIDTSLLKTLEHDICSALDN
jgi:hypothetical protein